ncbi:MAG: IclR family transcriptional regulator [Bryobacterales bacterium]|nr:IclR family transcriptional regulator [Bryobacterales bacterium]
MKTEARSGIPGVGVLNKAVDVLETLREAPAGLALGGVASAVRLPKPTVYRILATLEARGYLDRTPDGGYRLSRKMFEPPAADITEQAIQRAARPEMERLLDRCRETLNLGVLDGSDVLVIQTIESPLAVRMSSKIGNRRYPHSTALGKVLLAALAEKDVLRIARTKGLPRFTAHTITTGKALIVELEKVRRLGYALDNCENEPDGRCVAAPIFGPGRKVIGALSVSGPLPRMTVSRARSLLPDLCATCDAISAAVGGKRS